MPFTPTFLLRVWRAWLGAAAPADRRLFDFGCDDAMDVSCGRAVGWPKAKSAGKESADRRLFDFGCDVAMDVSCGMTEGGPKAKSAGKKVSRPE